MTKPGFRLALLLVALPCLLACGGGGSEGETPDDWPPPGITGRVYSGFDLGTLAEQEPNDSRAQSHRLPPIAALADLEVVGTADETDDPTDAFRFEVTQTQTVGVRLDWAAKEGSPGLTVAVQDPQSGVILGETTPGAPPRETSFSAERGVVYDVVVTTIGGRAAWTLGFEGGAAIESFSVTSASRRTTPDASRTEALACATTHVLVATVDDAAVESLAHRHGARVGRRLAAGGVRLELPDTMEERDVERIRAFCRQLATDEAVLWAEPDWKVRPLGLPDNREMARQWNLRAIGCPEAWDTTMGSNDVVVGVVDSGIVEHPDLVGRIAAGGYDFISDPYIAGDGDGRDRDPTDEGAEELQSGRSMWHGTHVAGILAAASGSDRGICGVAPGCRVLVLRALGRTGGLVSDVSDAILYAAGLLVTQEGYFLRDPLPIVNLSFGLDVESFALERACERAADAGVLLVGASGNDGDAVLYPAKYPSVVAVGAVDAMLETLDYSNYGEEVDIAAPGGDVTKDLALDGWPDGILSTVLDETVYPVRRSHAYLEGTSQSCPHVAGAAALLLSVDPTLDAATLKDHLFRSALDRGIPGRDDAYGWGVVQAHLAVRRVLDDLGTPADATPRPWLPVQSLGFVGFDDRIEVPIGNAGGGTLELAQPLSETDDGDPWLQARVEEPVLPTITNADRLVVTVDRTRLPLRGRYAGTVRMRDGTGNVLQEVRVVVYVQDRPFAGQNLTVVTVDPSHGFPRIVDTAAATAGYRYWMSAVTSGSWKIRAGQDLDGDGRSCEAGDACGWHGGTSEDDAVLVEVPSPGTVENVDVDLLLPD